jgi:hypothetical protein
VRKRAWFAALALPLLLGGRYVGEARLTHRVGGSL